MTDTSDEGSERGIENLIRRGVARRTVLRAAGATTALGLGAGTAVADEHAETADSDDGSEGGDSTPELDPIFGYASADPNPCGGDAGDDCVEAFPESVRPDAEVEMSIDLPGAVLAIAEQGALSEATMRSINDTVADGEVDRGTLRRPDATVEYETPEGTESLSVQTIAEMVADSLGFYFDPAGLRVAPGDVVLFSAETPDHGVAAYHERHGRQNSVPDGAPPISSPLVPVQGYWLYRFETPGVYDFYCPPHQLFGMVCRVVVTEGDVPEQSVEDTGRPPEAHNSFPTSFGGVDPNLPSSMDALTSDVLSPGNVVEEGRVDWADVVAEHRRDA